MKNPWIIVGALTILLFGGAIWYSGVAAEKNNEGVEVKDHILGNPDADIVLAEYSDLQCPACAAFEPAVAEVLDLYGDSIRFEYKHFPLPIHPYAIQSAVAAEAAGQQDMFFEFHNLLFENQTTWSNSQTPNILFLQYAEELGLDIPTFKRHINSSVLKDGIQASFNAGREMGITGTPTFYLNGVQMEISTYQDFIDQVGATVNPGSDTDNLDVPVSVDTGVKFGL